VQGEHISITPTTCFLCHFKNLDQEERAELSACTKCHDAPAGDYAREHGLYDHSTVLEGGVECQSCHQPMWQGEGEVRKERCGVCHSESQHINRIDDLEFIHEWHIEKRKVDCGQCHDVIEHKQPELDKIVRSECSTCHSDPHMPMLSVYRGEGSRLVEGSYPDPMYNAGVACFSCHKNPLTGHGEARVGDDACTPCHTAAYQGLVDNWKSAFTTRIDRLEKGLRRSSGHPQIEDARHDVALVRRGGAWHNPAWSSQVLDAVQHVLADAGHAEPPASIPAESRQCLACHGGIESVKIHAQFSSMDHGAHLADRGITCTECHARTAPEDPAHGQRKPVEQSCANCHHSEEVVNVDNNCTPCHEPSRRNYLGQLPGIEADASPMAQMDMACGDCHFEETGYSPPKDDYCMDCHEPEIIDDLEFKRGRLRTLVNDMQPPLTPAQTIIKLDGGRAVHHPDLSEQVSTTK
jgi:hypothetical protein